MKKRFWNKKVLCIVLCLAMALPLAACGGNDKPVSTMTKLTNVYRSDDITLGSSEEIGQIGETFAFGDRLYFLSYQYGENYKTLFHSVKLDGTDLQELSLPLIKDASIQRINMDADGNLVMVQYVYQDPNANGNSGMDGDGDGVIDGGIAVMPRASSNSSVVYEFTAADIPADQNTAPSDPAEPADDPDDADAPAGDTPAGDTPAGDTPAGDTPAGSDDGADAPTDGVNQPAPAPTDDGNPGIELDVALKDGENYILVKADAQGKVLFQLDLSQFQPEDQNYFYINSMALGLNGEIYLVTEQTMIVLDENGSHLFDIQFDNWVNDLFVTAKGVFVSYYGDHGMVIKQIDLDKKALSEDVFQFPGEGYNYTVVPSNNSEYDVLIRDQLAVYGYNFGDEEPTELLNFINSDLDISGGVNNLSVAPEGKFLLSGYDYEVQKNVVQILSPVAPEDVKEKIILNFACNYLNYDIRRAIIRFNKANDTYRITVKDYSSYNTQEDYNAGVKALNNDIASGKGPDILAIDSYGMPVDSYAAKGLFADLGELMDKDPDFDRSELFPSILEAATINGKIYSLIPLFSIQTLAGKTSDVGEKMGWTLEDMKNLLASKPEGTQLLPDMTKLSFLNMMILMNKNEYINKDTGECYFDTDGFIDLLDFINGTFPTEINYEDRDESYWDNYETQFLDGRTLLSDVSIYYLRDINRTEKGTFGEPVTYIGFPNNSGSIGTSISPQTRFAISSKSANKEGAWEFLKYFLSDEFYELEGGYGLPIKISRFEKMAEQAMTPETYTDENGVEQVITPSYWINGQRVELGLPTQEMIDKVRSLIDETTQILNYDDALMKIIEDETAPFFAGQKSAKDVVNIINSKVSIYISESR